MQVIRPHVNETALDLLETYVQREVGVMTISTVRQDHPDFSILSPSISLGLQDPITVLVITLS